MYIAAFTPDDAGAWRALFGAYNAFYEVALPEAVYAATWRRLIAADGDLRGFVAREPHGAPVGFAHYFFHGSTWSTLDRCYLEDLFVAPEARGAGIGRALIAAVTEAARERGCDRLYWHTHESNAPARRLYEAVASYEGFIRYEIRL
jgi:GNAT superfamily N-acetyltransferase